MISPPIDLSPFTPATFLGLIDSFLADTAATLHQPATTLLAPVGAPTIHKAIKQALPGGVTFIDDLTSTVPAILGPGAALAGVIFNNKARQIAHARQCRKAFNLIQQFSITHPVGTLKARERTLLQEYAKLIAVNAITPDQWSHFLARLAWSGGEGHPVPDPAVAFDPMILQVTTILRDILKNTQPTLDAAMGEAAAVVALKAHHQGNGPASAPTFKRGVQWLKGADVDATPYLTAKPTRSSLFIGRAQDTRKHVYFNGHESLITIAGPGAGKSQTHVIPNLLIYKGSALVLDVKGELWDLTAAHRAAHFGPVFKFAPGDLSGRSHCYNPFDQISTAPQEAAHQCDVLAHQIVPHNPDLKDPYWENRARNFLSAFATLVAIASPLHQRRMATIATFANIPTKFEDLTNPEYLTSTTYKLVKELKRIGTGSNIPDLAHTATALENGIGDAPSRIESVLDQIRRHLSLFARSATFRNITARSDWSPSDLRTRTGTTVYLCIPPTELETYAPFLRLIFAQHLHALAKHQVPPDQPPITFFLDEMPQLGRFEDILKMQDIGRGSGLRLWMFAQHSGQIRKAYGTTRADGVIEANRIRCYMEPDADTAKHLERTLGDTVNELTGEKKPLATAAELVSDPRYTTSIITTVRGHKPILLDKYMAYQKLAHLFRPAPTVPVAPNA